MIAQILQNIYKAKSNRSILLGVLVLVGSLFNINITLANTGVNPQIPYSASIIKNDGTALSDGTYRAKFLVYNLASGGTAIYEEIRDGSTSYAGTGVSPALTVSDGRFEILLGSQNTTNFTSVLNDDSLWLELQLDMDNNSSYEEIFSPRRRLGSSLYSINSMRLVANGGSDTDTLSLDVAGNVVSTALGGVANSSTPVGFDRVLLANSSGQFSQVNISALSGSSGWALAGNSTTDAWNGTSGTRLGTTSAQPLVLATTNATAQDIRFFTGANGANERMRILGTGNVGIGTTSPTARLHIVAGTATANTAPLKFTSGTNLTTAEAGAMEWDGTNLFLTNNSSTRQTINQGLTATANLDFASTNNGSFTDLTVTVTGAALNDVVSLGIPNGSVPAANANFTAWVSAANTVTVRFSNHSGVAQDPASGSFKVFVTKF